MQAWRLTGRRTLKMATVIAPTRTLNIKGMPCPMPIIWAKSMLKSLKEGEVLEVLATDPDTIRNFKSFAHSTGNELVDWSESKGQVRVLLMKHESPA